MAVHSVPHAIPGPKIGPIGTFRMLRQRGEARLQMFMALVRTYGDLVHFRLGPQQVYLLNRPDYIHHVLVTAPEKVHKGPGLKRNAADLIGQGLLTVEDQQHKHQRKLMQPSFHATRIAGYADLMVDYTCRRIESWKAGQIIDAHEEMMSLTRDIVAKALFDADVSSEGTAIADAITGALEALNDRALRPLNMPQWVPTPNNRKRRENGRIISTAVMRILNERRASGKDAGDLLSMMLMASDDESGKLSQRELHDNVLTLFVAGHETTANALSWSWYLLAQHPETAEKLRAEAQSALGGRAPTVQDLPNLPYTDMVLKEAMRLYPPVWVFSREVITPLVLGDYTLPKGSFAFLLPYVMHRDPRYYSDPDTFIPERWAGDFEKKLPKGAYFPFGAGPRVCIGQPFAMMEGRLILATMAQKYRLDLVPGQDIHPEPIITLRPGGGVKMRVVPLN